MEWAPELTTSSGACNCSVGAGRQQRDFGPATHEHRLAWEIAPFERKGVAVDANHDRLPPAVLNADSGEHDTADADLIPVLWPASAHPEPRCPTMRRCQPPPCRERR